MTNKLFLPLILGIALLFLIFLFAQKIFPPKIINIENKESTILKISKKEKEEKPTIKDKDKKKDIIINAVGDIMLSRWVAEEIAKAGDVKHPFLKTAKTLKNADILFGNLETPITEGKKIQINEMILRSNPEVIDGLKFAGFSILSLANNHFGDFGQIGMKNTFKFLKEEKISYVGAGRNKKEAHSVTIKQIRGKKIGFLAYSDRNFTLAHYEANKIKPGIAPMRKEGLREDIKKAKKETDFLIISMHAGKEYQKLPTFWQKEFAKLAIDYGADLILGHHPHIIQPYEKYKEKYIFYSLGNFVFDQDTPNETKHSVILKLALDNKTLKIKEINPIPVLIEKYSQPVIKNGQKEKILKNFYLIE